MIRRTLLLVVLLAVGFALLYWLGGKQDAATGPAKLEPSVRDPRATTGIAVPVERDPSLPQAERPVIRVRVEGGAIRLPRNREITLPDGGRMLLPLYRLNAEDSQQLADDRLKLLRVRIELFEISGLPDRPQAIPSGELLASEATVVVAPDEQGRPSIEEDRDIDLRDVVLTTPEQARVAGVRLEVGQAFVRSEAQGLLVRTGDPREPFTLTRSGPRPMRIDGLGLDGRFPHGRSLDRVGDESVLTVLAEPVLEFGGRSPAKVRARGPMTLREQAASGRVTLHTEQDVVVETAMRGAPATIHGERLDATLLRTGSDAQQGGDWVRFVLTGAPVTLEAKRLGLRCRELRISPAPDGRPYLLTAIGDPRLTTQTPRGDATFACRGELHVVRYGERWLGPLAGAGGPFGTGVEELLLLEQEAWIETAELTASASDGMQLARGPHARGPLLLAGSGDVRITNGPDATFTGNDGFLLRTEPGNTRVLLGPHEPDPAHVYELRHGGQRIAGSGACQITREDSGDLLLRLRSPASDIDVTLAGDRGNLRRAGTLDARIAGDALAAVTATGAACEFTFATPDGPVTGTATRIHSTDARVVELTGAPAALARSADERITARAIEVTRLSGGGIVLHATEHAQLAVRLPGDPSAPQAQLELTAQQLQLLPWLASPATRWFLATPHRAGTRLLLDRMLGSESLLADHDCLLVQKRDGQELGRARGDLLRMRVRGRSGVISGSAAAPAELVRIDERGRRTRARAVAVEFAQGSAGEHLLLREDPAWSPHLEFTGTLPQLPAGDAQPRGDEQHRLVCDGPIEVTPAQIRCLGPITLRALHADGSEDSQGLRLDAQRLLAERDRKTGEVVRLHAIEDATLRWAGLDARGARMTLDLRRQVCVLEDAAGLARISAPGASWSGRRAEYYYASYALRAWHSEFANASDR